MDASTASDASQDFVEDNLTHKKKRKNSSKKSLDKGSTLEKQGVDLQQLSPSKEQKQTEIFLVDIQENVHPKEGESQEADGKRKLPQDSGNSHKKAKTGVTDVPETETASIFSIGPEPATEADPLDTLVSNSIPNLNEQVTYIHNQGFCLFSLVGEEFIKMIS